jgi:hypothetical protein
MKPDLNSKGDVRTTYITKISMKISKCGWGVNVIDNIHSEKVVHKTPTLGWLQEFLNFYFFTDNGGVNSIDTIANNYSVTKQFKQTVLVYV